MGEEKSRDIAGITVRYSDGNTKEIQSGALLLLDVGDKKKRPEDEPDQTEEWLKPPEHINCRCTIYYPLDKKRKCKRRPKGQTGRKHPKGKREV